MPATVPAIVPAIVVALKWVDLRPEVDRLSGAVHHDERFGGASPADLTALEWALRMADAWDGSVTAITAGPVGADALLRHALAAGASDALRVAMPEGAPSDRVAGALHDALAERVPDASLVCCGDWSLDRGSGSVPAFLAAELGWGQALGLVGLTFEAGAPGTLTAVRRLDGGRREVLAIDAPTVLSFEGGTAELRRAPLSSILRVGDDPVPALTPAGSGTPDSSRAVHVLRTGPDRPRARQLAPPDPARPPRDRILALTGAHTDRTPPRTVVAEPDEAAALILEQLSAWGFDPLGA